MEHQQPLHFCRSAHSLRTAHLTTAGPHPRSRFLKCWALAHDLPWGKAEALRARHLPPQGWSMWSSLSSWAPSCLWRLQSIFALSQPMSRCLQMASGYFSPDSEPQAAALYRLFHQLAQWCRAQSLYRPLTPASQGFAPSIDFREALYLQLYLLSLTIPLSCLALFSFVFFKLPNYLFLTVCLCVWFLCPPLAWELQ